MSTKIFDSIRNNKQAIKLSKLWRLFTVYNQAQTHRPVLFNQWHFVHNDCHKTTAILQNVFIPDQLI